MHQQFAKILVGSSLMIAFGVGVASMAQDTIYDESLVPAYRLPQPLVSVDGEVIQSKQQWLKKRRPEILKLFQQHVFGVMPEVEQQHAVAVVAERRKFSVAPFVVDPKAAQPRTVSGTVREITLSIKPSKVPSVTVQRPGFVGAKSELPLASGEDENIEPLKLRLLIISPTYANSSVPAFLGYNFNGNHTVTERSEVSLDPVWDRGQKKLVIPAESTRGERANRWPIGLILDRGYGLVTLNYGDVDPDFFDEFKNGAHRFFPDLQNRPDNWSTIGAWAWGLHRVLDYLEVETAIDSRRVTVFGHSRLGKTSLWAGATDDRLAAVISNNSGCGGAALSRRRFGESVKRINKSFPHWFCLRHRDYDDNEDALPVDHHLLIALSAPRPVYIASAKEDRWADPKGEFLSAFHASGVYELFGLNGIGLKEPVPPDVDQPVGNQVRYHVRRGKHDVTRFDWMQYLEFADRHVRNQR